MSARWFAPEYIEKVRQNLVAFDSHKIGDANCEGCKWQVESHKVDTYGSFPKVHSCGGYIHIEIEWQGDEGWESPYSRFTCENCGSLQDEEIES